MIILLARGCSSVGRASDRHAAEAGSIAWCGKGVFSKSQLSVQTLLRVFLHPHEQPHASTSVRTLDPVVHVRVRWIMETLKRPACTVGWVARICRSWLSPGKSKSNIPCEKSHWDNTVVKSIKKRKKKKKKKKLLFTINKMAKNIKN